jgi:hypothetical protein
MDRVKHSSCAIATNRKPEVLARASVPQLPSCLHGFRLRHLVALPLQCPGMSFVLQGDLNKSPSTINCRHECVLDSAIVKNRQR